MFALGFLVYAFCVFSYYKFTPIQAMLDQGIALAPVIVYSMLVMGCYPLAVFSYHVLFKKRSKSARIFLESQSKIASTVAVSLGLIGTFQGLTQMVATIASSMNGAGDMTERMAAMLSSISGALSSMSYTFLTSIVGVGISVVVIIAVNFFSQFYSRNEQALTEQNRALNSNPNQSNSPDGKLYEKELASTLKELVRLTEASLICQKQDIKCSQEAFETQQKITSNLNSITDNISQSVALIEEQINENNRLLSLISDSVSKEQISTKVEDAKAEVMNKLDYISSENQSIKETVKLLPGIFSLAKQIKQSLEKLMSIFSFESRK